MRKIKLYIAISLNGKIAKANGDVEWLNSIPNPNKNDFGYSEFYHSVDTTIQGYSTYQKILSMGIEFPYADKKNFVLTSKNKLVSTKYVEFIDENHIEFVNLLKKGEGKDIWLIGGGKTNTWFLDNNLIDQLIIFVMPIIINGGIDLFEFNPVQKLLNLTDTKKYSNGVVRLTYSLDTNLANSKD